MLKYFSETFFWVGVVIDQSQDGVLAIFTYNTDLFRFWTWVNWSVRFSTIKAIYMCYSTKAKAIHVRGWFRCLTLPPATSFVYLWFFATLERQKTFFLPCPPTFSFWFVLGITVQNMWFFIGFWLWNWTLLIWIREGLGRILSYGPQTDTKS